MLIEKHNNESLAIVTHAGVMRAWINYILTNDFKFTGTLNPTG